MCVCVCVCVCVFVCLFACMNEWMWTNEQACDRKLLILFACFVCARALLLFRFFPLCNLSRTHTHSLSLHLSVVWTWVTIKSNHCQRALETYSVSLGLVNKVNIYIYISSPTPPKRHIRDLLIDALFPKPFVWCLHVNYTYFFLSFRVNFVSLFSLSLPLSLPFSLPALYIYETIVN